VLVGRPVLWALAVSGQQGVETALKWLRDDLIADMKSMGITSLDELGPHCIYGPDRERLGI
jgi:isopentenyl diphosphate isomerase/L-lactate dehydrogenase-like FMN-dependent dehydrogenase